MRVDYAEPPKILIVDDEDLVLSMFAEVLKSRYDVMCAASGMEALTMLEADSPELVIMDVDLPDIDGFEVCRRLKQNPVTADIPIIFQTRFEDRDTILKGFDAGASDYVFKGASMMVLMARIDIHIQLYRYKRALDRAQEQNRQLQNKIEHLMQSGTC